NLMRMYGLKPKENYEALARRIAAEMPKVGMDRQRGGWYDVMERMLRGDEEVHRFAFHDRKAWWQQEQGILAYLILNGILGDAEYLKLARESAAFYNAFFLDHDDGAVFFNVLANGIPYLMGTERFKGSHSMSGYHSTELCFLAATYSNLLITKQPLDLYFKPLPDAFKRNLLRVSPDILPPGSVRISEAWVNDEPYSNFDAEGLTVKLPDTKEQVRVKVRLVPNEKGAVTS
ncbi:MAG TPA: N-acyl-D-glucosamine 2-epimerase, partial [Anaerolineae bacterium]|nr:N-acyl-D-glucosamine 2-epimerase [Anaerolineae bacterium]